MPNSRLSIAFTKEIKGKMLQDWHLYTGYFIGYLDNRFTVVVMHRQNKKKKTKKKQNNKNVLQMG
jgi:hypothetical protein